MSYNKFKKLAQLQEDFGISSIQSSWLPNLIQPKEVTNLLKVILQEASQETLTTEKAKSEYIVVPILNELRRQNIDKFKTFSGFEFQVDSKLGLSGYCDFILSIEAQKLEITAPVFCLVEAKKAEIDRGLAQCGAEMYAAQIFNEQKGMPRKAIYGCVTNAFSWCFLKLTDKNLYIDPNYVPLTFARPHEVLAVLQWILDESLKPQKHL
jgi:hypothetical protein